MTAPVQPQINPKSGTVKLKPKQLQTAIYEVLQSNPGKHWTLPEISAQLGRTSGAVPLAARRLVELGLALQVGRRSYTLAPPGTAPSPPAVHPSRPSPAGLPPSKPAPVTRPNGTVYHPRKLATGNDIQVLRDLRTAGLPVLLYGPPGTGKTSLIEAAFGEDIHTLAGDDNTTVGDIVGDYVPDGNGGYLWYDGPLTLAMQSGGVFFIDDSTLIDPRVLAVVYPAMDGRHQIILKANGGRIVTAAPGFYVVAGHNPGVHGAILTEALASRFSVHIQVSTDYDLARHLGVSPAIVTAARALSAKVTAGECGWAPQMRELLGFQRLATTLGRDAAIANLVGIAPAEDRDFVIAALKDALKTDPAGPLALGPQL